MFIYLPFDHCYTNITSIEEWPLKWHAGDKLGHFWHPIPNLYWFIRLTPRFLFPEEREMYFFFTKRTNVFNNYTLSYVHWRSSGSYWNSGSVGKLGNKSNLMSQSKVKSNKVRKQPFSEQEDIHYVFRFAFSLILEDSPFLF